jgi:hypothetical protein
VVGDASAVDEKVWAGVCAGFALGAGIGDGREVAEGFDPESEARAVAAPALPAELKFPALRAVVELARRAVLLLPVTGAAVRLLAFEFLFASALLLADSGDALL